MADAGVVIRQARQADLPAIIALLADDQLGQHREEASDSPAACYRDAFAAITADPNQMMIVAESEGRVVGTLQLTFIPGLSRRGAWRGQVESVRVAKDHRNAGLGQAMMEWVEATCRARGCALVQLTTDKQRADAHRFYARLGYVASHEGFKKSL